jgi:hypothetical protein
MVIRYNVVRELNKSLSMTGRPETLILRKHLEGVLGEATRQALIQLIPYLVLFLFPMLWTKHDYALPLTWFAVPLMAFKLTQLANHSGNSSATGTTAGTASLGSATLFGKHKHNNHNGTTLAMGSYAGATTLDQNTTCENDTDEGDAYELEAGGNIRTGVASFNDMDSVPLSNGDLGSQFVSRNPSFTKAATEPPPPSGV